MDSFFSLFDPSEGNQNKHNKKRNKSDQDNRNRTEQKKPDAPKGRRRGRKAQGKNETLPEESSFLCEPQLSNEVLVKDGSYIESFIEISKKDEDIKIDPDKKPKRRNSGRKSRRKKNKISPAKDIVPNIAWNEDADQIPISDTTNWNNQLQKPKICDDNIGKNVNDLSKGDEEYKRTKRKDRIDENDDKNLMKDSSFDECEIYNVIDKLEKVNLKDDLYLSEDFIAEDLGSDFFYSSDEIDEPFDDSSSEPDDSGEESYGSLPPEPRFGNVEYKLQLVSPCERRFQHLVTQLKWRLRSGGGTAIYVLGVRDCGALRGLRARALRASLRTLARMARALSAQVAHAAARRVAPHRAVAEVYVTKLPDTQQSVELRVAVMGANEAGKSTLIGVLTQGELDNGRGSARLNMFRHLHEVKSGRTSSLSHEILGFDAQGNVVNYGCSELMTAERIGERSAKLVSFLDLAGHSKYQRTTLHGLTGYCPHYAMLVISATAGITPITEEHLGLLLALDLPFFIVITKCELAPPAVEPLITRLGATLAPANKKPMLITDENLARNCVAPQKLILDTIDNGSAEIDNNKLSQEDESPLEQIPVFPVSCVRGIGLNSLHAYLLALQPPTVDVQPKPEDDTCEFQIDEIFHVGDSTGPVVGGLLARGQLYEGDNLIIGPLDTGEFVPISVKTIYRNRVRCGCVRAGQSASLGLGAAGAGAAGAAGRRGAAVRPGMVLLAARGGRGARPVWGECEPGRCEAVKELILNRQEQAKKTENHKNVRRKNKNLLQDLAKVENSLVKDSAIIEEGNIYKSDSEGDKHMNKMNLEGSTINTDACMCQNKVLLEDPNDPRGCLYFQATIHRLRHSTAIYPGFQCTVHVGNVRQTAIIEGIMSHNSLLRSGETASVVFRFSRCPEYLVRGRRLIFTAGLGTRAIGRVTQVFPYVP